NSYLPLFLSVLEFERVYLTNLPSAAMYERSYKEVFLTDFIITASHDGHVKFWKKKEDAGIGFVKHFRSHLGVIECIGISAEGALFCSVGDDQAMKVFDVVNFDMIDMLKLGFHPGQCEWIYNPGDAVSAVACSEKSTGKIFVYDGRGMFTELQQMRQQLPDIEFGRRMAVERELEKVDGIRLTNVIFDETGHFVLYGTMLGIKVINVETNRCVWILGKQENIGVVQLDLFQGIAKVHHAAPTIEMKASDSPALQRAEPDPTIFCTAFKKNRFYMFTKREPAQRVQSDRDIFNEKPSKEEVMAATQAEGPKRVSDSAVIHTTIGDVHIKLFLVEYVFLLFNAVSFSLQGFMIQTGDPTGTGVGGESIWGGEFGDEFHATLRHDRPYTPSMANGGPGTNGAQFFITVVPTPWLDNKHTVFGRITKGMEVIQRISNVKINPKTDKPYEDIITVK
ncbi:PPWD1 protein, partial [Polyodon spathula]|nr:PPWD1 protein [Polyodon spathula]